MLTRLDGCADPSGYLVTMEPGRLDRDADADADRTLITSGEAPYPDVADFHAVAR